VTPRGTWISARGVGVGVGLGVGIGVAVAVGVEVGAGAGVGVGVGLLGVGVGVPGGPEGGGKIGGVVVDELEGLEPSPATPEAFCRFTAGCITLNGEQEIKIGIQNETKQRRINKLRLITPRPLGGVKCKR
jgi:hypothetical protein